MSILEFTIGKSGAGGANSEYITRLSAADQIAFHNLDHLASENLSEARINAISYAYAREEIELAKNKKAITHYRIIYSFEGGKSSEEVIVEVKKNLKKQFPGARAIIAVHQNTDDTHAHVWLDVREVDGRLLHITGEQYRTLDERWTEQYDARYGTNYAPEYKAKKEETKQWKRDMAEWRKAQSEVSFDGREVTHTPAPVKPKRASDAFKTDYWRAKEIQELSGSKELPALRDESKPAEIKPPATVQSVEEKRQIIEQQVDSYLLDLQKMMRKRRENLIREVHQACRSILARNGVTDEGIEDHVIPAVDHFIDQGSYYVRTHIRAQLEQGSRLGEQIALADKNGSEAVHNLLRNTADLGYSGIIDHALETHHEELRQKLYKPSEFFAPPVIDEILNDYQGEENYEKNGYGTGDRTAQSGSRSIEDSERTGRGEKSDSARNYQPAQRGAETTQILDQAEKRSSETARTTAKRQELRTDPLRRTEQVIGALSETSETNDFAERKSGEDYGQSETNQQSSYPIQRDERERFQLRDVYHENAGQTTVSTGNQNEAFREFYENGFGGSSGTGKSIEQQLPGSFAGVKGFEPPPIDLIKPLLIEASEMQAAVSQKTLAEQMMQMMKDSLAAQNTKLSPRAEQKYEAQLKRDGETMPTSQELEKFNELNLKIPEEKRVSAVGKSKLEIAHEMITKASDEECRNAFAAKAKKLEDQVKLEQLEKLQRIREIPFEI